MIQPKKNNAGESGMSTINLHRLFNPKSVAVVGASEKKDTVG